MMTNISGACPDAESPMNYTQSGETWECFDDRVYDAQTHTCQVSQSDNKDFSSEYEVLHVFVLSRLFLDLKCNLSRTRRLLT